METNLIKSKSLGGEDWSYIAIIDGQTTAVTEEVWEKSISIFRNFPDLEELKYQKNNTSTETI